MVRSILKVLIGICLIVAGFVASVLMPILATGADANLAGAFVQLAPYLVVILGLVMCVVGVIQFVFRMVRGIASFGPGSMAGSDPA